MNYKTLFRESEICDVAAADIGMTQIPPDAIRLLSECVLRAQSCYAAFPRENVFLETVELSSYAHASGSWYADRKIGFLIWRGDLIVEGDLIDDHFDAMPMLIVGGNLCVHNWLRGGMPTFVGGNVRAKGFVIGHYNDSALFVGGDLQAAGYLPRAKPHPDFPKMRPHQFGGRIDARQFDHVNCSDEALRATFVDEVLAEEESEGEDETQATLWFDERAAMARWRAGLSVWRPTR